MKKGWRIVIIIVLVAITLGAISVGVGVLTGADFDRISAVLDDRYHIAMYWDYAIDVINTLETELA